MTEPETRMTIEVSARGRGGSVFAPTPARATATVQIERVRSSYSDGQGFSIPQGTVEKAMNEVRKTATAMMQEVNRAATANDQRGTPRAEAGGSP